MQLQNTASLERPKTANIGLWSVQILLAVVFGAAGYMKATYPIGELVTYFIWPGQVHPLLVRFIGVSELAAAFGLILPSATRILPKLTPLAAAGLVLIMILAFGFHFSRGEYAVLPMNVGLGALAAYAAWGRLVQAPVPARHF